MSGSQTLSYSGFSKLLHWMMALMIFGLVAVGLYMAELPDDAPNRAQLYGMHKSMGVLLLILLLVRLAWLRIRPAPALPEAFAAKERLVIKGVQAALYLLMALLPISGYLMSTAAGYPVTFFGLFKLPALVGESKELAGFAKEMHELGGYATILFVLLHMIGAVKHRLKDKGGPTDILQRML